MDNGNVGDAELDVMTLSDVQLAQKLRELGANIGPIIDSTRHIYQLKLQHWLKKGSVSGSPSLSELGPDTSTADNSAIGKNGHPSITEAADISNNSGSAIEPDSPEQVPKVSAKLKQVTDLDGSSLDAKFTPVVSGERGRNVAPVAMSKNGNGSGAKQKVVVTSESTKNDVLFASQEDGNIMEEVTNNAPQISTPYRSVKHAEISSDEPEVRSRFLSHDVTPRPALHSYGIDSDYSGRNIMSDQRLSSRSFVTSTPYQKPTYAAKLGSSASYAEQTTVGGGIARWLVFIVVLAILVGIAVYFNMEQAYIAPA